MSSNAATVKIKDYDKLVCDTSILSIYTELSMQTMSKIKDVQLKGAYKSLFGKMWDETIKFTNMIRLSFRQIEKERKTKGGEVEDFFEEDVEFIYDIVMSIINKEYNEEFYRKGQFKSTSKNEYPTESGQYLQIKEDGKYVILNFDVKTNKFSWTNKTELPINVNVNWCSLPTMKF